MLGPSGGGNDFEGKCVKSGRLNQKFDQIADVVS